jgi:adenosylcobinamide-GDP ribazoletransferase
VLAVAAWRDWFSLAALGASLGVAGAAALLLSFWFRRRAGGITGDFLGATEQVGECAVLLTLLAFAVQR